MNAQAAVDVPIVVESSDPPSKKLPPGEWLKVNLFSSFGNSLTTAIMLVAAGALLFVTVSYVIGVEWQIIRTNLALFMVGRFPRDELWRIWASLYLALAALGLTSAAVGRSSYELALEQGLDAVRDTVGDLFRRFWPVVAVSIFFCSFARTLLPFIGLAVAPVVLLAAREVGWRLPPVGRRNAPFIGGLVLLGSMFVLAGSSHLMGLAAATIVFLMAYSEFAQRLTETGLAGTAKRFVAALAVGAVAYGIVGSIPFEGFGWEDWGGIHVTFFVTIIGITLGMPFGILLAIARRSQLSVLQSASVIFIEFVRGVPLISLLLFSQLMLPFFLPQGFERPADLTLAIIVIMFFSAAYIAEIVRGGLQAVPKGQTEAGQAGGMSAWDIQRMIVLPQALRASIPAMVGQFIALFKDTTLLTIIGLGPELLGVSLIANSQAEFAGRGLAPLTYIFVGLGYWAFAYTLSKESRRLEAKLGVGTR